MATQTETQRKAAARKAAATRRRNAARRSQAARRAAETRAQAELSTLGGVQAQAERAVLIPVGAALTARDVVVDATKPYTASRESAERELTKLTKRVATNLRRFERRGNTARNRAVRQAKRTRTQFERQVRRSRSQTTRFLRRNRREAERQVKAARRQAERQVKTARRDAVALLPQSAASLTGRRRRFGGRPAGRDESRPRGWSVLVPTRPGG